MEFRILGPLEVVDGDRAVEVRGAKHRALLAILLLRANEVVSTDRLIDLLWEEQPPETGRKALQVYVSQLRKLLGKERLTTRTPGYVLEVGEGELDLDRFEQLRARGSHAEALSLWRGPPLAEFAFQRFAQSDIARLEELRLVCLEERIETDLAGGRHAELAGELDALVKEYPLRERLRAQLMLALYRSGRQGEALDAYQATRRTFVDELGIEPGRQLRDLHQAILNQDPSLEPPEEPADGEMATMPPAATAEPRAREVRKTVTVLFADVSISAEALDPEPRRRVLARCFDDLRPVLEGHGGTVERSMGGAVTAVFGIPTVHEDDPLRAVRAGAELRVRLADLAEKLGGEWREQLQLRAGLCTGEVVAGGDGERPSATGVPVDAAISLQQAAQPNEILLADSTFRLVRDFVEAEPADGHFRLRSVLPDAGGHVSRFASPMVGRERELRRLRDAFDQSVGDSSCQLFTVLGAAGVGKSRLVGEFLAGVVGQATVARGRCLPYGEGITFWPVMEAVKDAADLAGSETPEESLAKLAALLEGEEDAALIVQRVAETIGLTEAAAGAEDSIWAVAMFFAALARQRPLVLVFDDIHWGEATFLDLVEQVAEWSRDAPILLVCVARSELLDLRPAWGGGKPNATSILLEPLSEAESAQLVDQIGGLDLDGAARERIVEAAEGNPLFVEEMLALVLEDGEAEGELIVPPTIQALLSARLDRLSLEERTAIEAASIEGKVFHEESVVELVAAPEPAVREHLAALVRKELLRPDRPLFPGARAFRFRHLLIRDAAYDSIPKGTRAVMHEGYATWLDGKAGERAFEYEEIIGYHLERAFCYVTELGAVGEGDRALARRAAERLGSAGRRAFFRSDAPAGANLVSRATALLPPDDPLRVELVPNVRVVQGMTDLSWADRVLTEAVEAAATTGNRQLAAHALVQRGLLRLFTESEVTAKELFDVAERAIVVFEELGDELGLARAWRLVAQAHYLDCSLARCAEASERALEHARRARDRFEVREIVEWLVIALLLGPAPATEAAERCWRLHEEASEDPPLQAEILGTLAPLVAMQGRLSEAHELASRSKAMVDVSEWIWIVSFWLGLMHLWSGDMPAAERELRPGYDELKRIGAQSHFSSIAHCLANVMYSQGRYDEAEELARECEDASRANDGNSQIFWRSTRAKVLARRGEFGAAERMGREAVSLAEKGDLLPARADALMHLAEVLQLAGRREGASTCAAQAVRLYELKENVLGADLALARLDELRD
jgi:DNA-binding SARP family transcriptional activator